MEGRVVLLNGDMIAVRLTDSSYSVFRTLSPHSVEIGDSFLGSLSSTGPQLLLHCRTQQWIDVKVKLARSQVAARTKRYLLKSNPLAAH
jgi:hypothetical protein